MRSKPLRWRLALATIFIFTVILAYGYGASYVSSQSTDSTIYLPVAVNVNGKTEEEEPPEENVFYISSTGNDGSDGTTESRAWATFDRAWKSLYPGDTLIILDGVYYQSLNPNVRNGTKDNPITIRAQNDGQAIIDGDTIRSPVVKLGGNFEGEPGQNPVGDYFVIEGITAINSSGSVYSITGQYNVLRRISGYNANTDTNAHVIEIWGNRGNSNLIEDCVAAGTGRKMIMIFKAEQNVIRRCLADWREHDSRLWHDCWPWGDGIEIYNASNNIIENSIAFSRNPTYAIHVQAQGDSRAIGNKVLGSMAILAGMKEDGVTPMLPEWQGPRPQPTKYTCVRNFDWPGQMSGFGVYEGDAQVSDNLWQDILAWGNAGLGLVWTIGNEGHPATGNNQINRATIFNNGLNNSDFFGGDGTDSVQADLERYGSVNNSYIETIYTGSGYTSMEGEGARLTHRYINGVLTEKPLWPWPMEDRIQSELGYSVTDLISGILSQLP